MPQGPQHIAGTLNTVPAAAPSQQTALNITAPTVVKAAAGFVIAVNVVVAGTAVGEIYDANSTTVTPAVQVAVIPEAAGNYLIGWPCLAGIVIVPGAGMTVAVSFT